MLVSPTDRGGGPEVYQPFSTRYPGKVLRNTGTTISPLFQPACVERLVTMRLQKYALD